MASRQDNTKKQQLLQIFQKIVADFGQELKCIQSDFKKNIRKIEQKHLKQLEKLDQVKNTAEQFLEESLKKT